MRQRDMRFTRVGTACATARLAGGRVLGFEGA
jgi:hypothetical protein